MPYCYSHDQNDYQGCFNTKEEAIAAGLDGYELCWVAEIKEPVQPEHFWDARDWLENVDVQDDYCIEQAEGWDESTKEQRQELECEVRAVMSAWLDRHNLRPKFWHAVNPELVTVKS